MDEKRERRRNELTDLQAMAQASSGHMQVTASRDLSEFTVHLQNLPAPVGTTETSYTIAEQHELRILLPSQFPEVQPILSFKRPLFHPNCFTSGGYCAGDQWYPARRLDDLVAQLIRNMQLRGALAFNLKSPANGAAARFYADSNKLAALRRRLRFVNLAVVYDVLAPPPPADSNIRITGKSTETTQANPAIRRV